MNIWIIGSGAYAFALSFAMAICKVAALADNDEAATRAGAPAHPNHTAA